MTGRATGRIVVVTGGARGIGRAIVDRFAAEGATVVIGDLTDPGELFLQSDVAAGLAVAGHREWVPLDVTDEISILAFSESVAAAHGGVDVLVNNAGLGNVMHDFAEFPMAEWDRVNAVNVRAPFALTKECLPLLEAAGTIESHASVINIASIDGIRIPSDNDWAYGQGKAALIHLTRQWAGELGNKGGAKGGRHITFNAIAPGPFPGMLDALLASEEGRAGVSAATVVGRVGEPEDIGAACIYLASRAGSYVTGAVLPVDGGFLVGRYANI